MHKNITDSLTIFKSVEEYHAWCGDDENKDSSCSICLQSIKDKPDTYAISSQLTTDEQLQIVPCVATLCHVYHRGCIHAWLTHQETLIHKQFQKDDACNIENNSFRCPDCQEPWIF